MPSETEKAFNELDRQLYKNSTQSSFGPRIKERLSLIATARRLVAQASELIQISESMEKDPSAKEA